MLCSLVYCSYTCTCTCQCVYMYFSVCVHVLVSVCTCTCQCVYMYLSVCVHILVSVCTCILSHKSLLLLLFVHSDSSKHKVVQSQQKAEYHICHHDSIAIQGTSLEDTITVDLILTLYNKNQCGMYIKNLFLDKLARYVNVCIQYIYMCVCVYNTCLCV